MKLFVATVAIGLLAFATAHAQNRFEADTEPASGAKIGRAFINANGQIAPAVTCKEHGPGSINVVFVMPTSFVGDSNTVVDVRFDGADAFRVSGTLVGQSLYLIHVKPNSPQASVLVGLKTAKHMSLLTWDTFGHRVVDEFDLGDAASVVQQVIDACGDTNWQ